MLVYRIAKQKYIHDLTGIGAKTVGGRWNPKGIAILYTSLSRSLSVLEVLVHLPAAFFPKDMSMATLELPENCFKTIKIDSLPEDWNTFPPKPALHNITIQWIEENKYLALKVPSSIVTGEYNVLINSLHPDFLKVIVKHVDPFSFDTRLLK